MHFLSLSNHIQCRDCILITFTNETNANQIYIFSSSIVFIMTSIMYTCTYKKTLICINMKKKMYKQIYSLQNSRLKMKEKLYKIQDVKHTVQIKRPNKYNLIKYRHRNLFQILITAYLGEQNEPLIVL